MRGRKSVRTRLLNNRPEGIDTPTPEAMNFEMEKGIIKIPNKLDVRVIARARAEFPPASRVSATPLDNVVGIQVNMAMPVINS